MPDSAYWDACLFIEAIQKTNVARFDACTGLVELAQKDTLRIVTSAYTLTEVNWLKALEKNGINREEQSKLILAFFQNSYIYVRPVNRQIAELAHEFTRTHGLRNADAIHVATAIIAKAQVLYTWDEKKQRRAGLLAHNLKIGTPPLRIEKPPPATPGPLFAAPPEDEAKPEEETKPAESPDPVGQPAPPPGESAG